MKYVSCITVVLLFPIGAFAQDLRRPNIILMMADDMGLGDTSAYQDFTRNSDADQVHTPAMEQLARMGVRFTDAHTPSSRCSPTRYGLLTGRYPWRNRLKHWVLFGAQGDPMIEADRPTLATLCKDAGYRTGMVGKWHIGLRYRQSDGRPAAGFEDADLRKPLFDSPLDHGFDFCRFTSRSHGTSGPEAGRKNRPGQTIGPGHIHGRIVIGATDNGRQLNTDGDNAYILKELGGRHSDSAIEFLSSHVSGAATQQKPFFLYYPSNSNHGPHTPDSHVGDQPVAGAGGSVSGEPVSKRGDYVFENDAALKRMIDWLQKTDDPRSDGEKLISNTLLIFTSDNGAEKNSDIATGPFRSNKGSCYEGGHRVPFIVSWPAGKIGDGNRNTPGKTSRQLLGLTDMFATIADILEAELPDNAVGRKGAEDSVSILASMQSDTVTDRILFFNDHKEADDHAAAAVRLDNPVIDEVEYPGQWKLFFSADLLRHGRVQAMELYDLATDPTENNDCMREPSLAPVVRYISNVALKHRTAGGHRLADEVKEDRISFSWTHNSVEQSPPDPLHRIVPLADVFHEKPPQQTVTLAESLTMMVSGVPSRKSTGGCAFSVNERGLGLSSGAFRQVDDGEKIVVRFNKDVIVESATVVAGRGVCGGFYKVGDHSPLAVYCVDADIDAQDQSGILSDIGVLRNGESLTLDSSPHLGIETAGRWRLAALTVRLLR